MSRSARHCGTAGEVINRGWPESDRMETLEQMVNQLREEVAALKVRLDRMSPDQDPGSRQ